MQSLPAVNVSASRDEAADPRDAVQSQSKPALEVACQVQGAKAQKVSGRILTAPAITAHNTFDKPETVKPSAFNAFRTTGSGLTATLPPASVVVLEIE